MTLREKQIDDFANSQADCKIFNVDLYTGITLGAKWADKHPNPDMVNKQEFIEKAISYFTPILQTYCSEECVKELIDGFVNSMGDRL